MLQVGFVRVLCPIGLQLSYTSWGLHMQNPSMTQPEPRSRNFPGAAAAGAAVLPSNLQSPLILRNRLWFLKGAFSRKGYKTAPPGRSRLAWHKLIWSISDGWACTNMCFFCHAKSTGRQRHLYCTYAGENASWRATIFRDTLPWVYNKLDLNKLCF